MLKTLFQFSVQSQKKTKRWYMEHINDFYVKESKRLNLRSRAAFKLMQIQEKYKIYEKNQNILDLGAAPGSWSQVISEYCKVIAVDLNEIEPIQNVQIIIGDVLSKKILNELKQKKFDVILSDMAPNVSGDHNCDHQAILDLNHITLLCNLVMKTFAGGEEKLNHDFFQLFFKELVREKPLSSRQDSSEIFYVGRGFNNKLLPQLIKEPQKILNYQDSLQNRMKKLIIEYKMLE